MDNAAKDGESKENELKQKLEQLNQEYEDSKKSSDEKIRALLQQLAQATQDQTALKEQMQTDSGKAEE